MVDVPPCPGIIRPILESEIISYIYNSNNPETKTDIPRVDTTPHGVLLFAFRVVHHSTLRLYF